MAPMLDKPSQIAKASRPASSNVATTSPRRTPRARNRAAHCSIDESSSDQLADSPVTVLTSTLSGDAFAWRRPIGGQARTRLEEHQYELQALSRITYEVSCLNKNK